MFMFAALNDFIYLFITFKVNAFLFRFVVKFYMPDPSQLEEEYTRYLAALQVRSGRSTQDILLLYR